MRKICLISLLFIISLSSLVLADSPSVRIKDIARVLEARENQLMGFGLVVGLNRTGDTQQTGFTRQALTNLLSRMGVVPEAVNFKSRNVAAVMVTAKLPAFVKSGQKIDVTVSSVGDASSLQGGTLLLTPLQGADSNIYAVAQGALSIGNVSEFNSFSPMRNQIQNVARIANGALVEKEVPVSMSDKQHVSIVLDQPDFTTASRVVDSIKKIGLTVWAQDAATIVIGVSRGENDQLVTLISEVENLTVVPDKVAKVVINERTGTVVIGENVKIAPVAVSYAGINIVIGPVDLFSETMPSLSGGTEDSTLVTTKTKAKVFQPNKKLSIIEKSATLSQVVNALNKVGVGTKDLIEILQAIKQAGALSADMEII